MSSDRTRLMVVLVLAFCCLGPKAAYAVAAAEPEVETEARPEVRIKDLVTVRGVRANFLNGLGLVVGLKSTGDSAKSLATNRAIANMLTRLGMRTKADEVATGNMAVVMVTAELPPFARIGANIDVKVSAVGDAKSLAGGTLVLTPLRAGDGEIYAVGQGGVVVGQASGNGPQVLTVARVPLGGTIEREFVPVVGQGGSITLNLKEADFTTASRIVEKINAHLKGFFASSTDLGSVVVQIPQDFAQHTVEFLAEIEGLGVATDQKAMVVVNERTGTVVMGRQVVLGAVAIAHGDLSIKIEPKGGKGGAGAKAAKKPVVALGPSTVGDLVETLNALGVKPQDLVGILQALHAAGALRAELKFL